MFLVILGNMNSYGAAGAALKDIFWAGWAAALEAPLLTTVTAVAALGGLLILQLYVSHVFLSSSVHTG